MVNRESKLIGGENPLFFCARLNKMKSKKVKADFAVFLIDWSKLSEKEKNGLRPILIKLLVNL